MFLSATRWNSLLDRWSWRDAGKRLQENTLPLKELMLDAWRLQTPSNLATPRMRFPKAKCLQDGIRAKGHAYVKLVKLAPPAILDSHFLASRISVCQKGRSEMIDESWVLVFHWPQGTKFICDRHHGICLRFLASRRSFVFDCLCCVFPNGRLFYSSQVCAANIG